MSTSTDVLAMLRRHYLPEGRPPGGAFVPELESPDGRRRADLIWMPTTLAGGKHLIGHEIKVSRADVLAELSDPTKADAWARYCAQWWLVVAHPRLVHGLDIPEAWGLMAPPSGRRTRSMTILRPAPRHEPIELGPAFRQVARWLMYRQETEVAGLRRDAEYAKRDAAAAHRQLEEARATGAVRHDPRAQRVAQILAAIDARGREPGSQLFFRDGELDQVIVEAIVDHQAVQDAGTRARWELRSLLAAAQQIAEPMKDTAKALAALEAPAVARG